MQDTRPPLRPQALAELSPEATAACPELAALAALSRAGLPVADVVVVPGAIEERFYRLNNLPRRLQRLFAAVDPEDPDEDDVEEAAPAAEALIAQHFLLDEVIDDFYAATRRLPAALRVRRAEEDGEIAVRGRPALLALKHTYQRDWSYQAVWGRLAAGRGVALEARPVLVHDASDGTVPSELARRAADTLGRRVALQASSAGRITGVRPG